MSSSFRGSPLLAMTIAALLAPSAGVLAAPQPQQSAAAESAGLENVTVTARRREERAQDVPVTMNTISEAVLEEQDIKTAFDLEKNISGLTVCCSRTSVGYSWIRGVRGVVAYWSEVPVTLGGASTYFDVGNIQALKGPQGTLFGLSTNGGAILSEPMRPTDVFEGTTSVTVGNLDRRTIEGVLNIPVSDSLQIRLGALSHYSDGYIHDISNNKNYGSEDYYILRASAMWQPTENFSNYAVLNYFDAYTTPSSGGSGAGDGVIEAFAPDGRARQTFGPATVDAFMVRQRELGRYVVVGTSLPGGPWTTTKQFNFADIAALELNEHLTFRTIGGIQSIELNTVTDPDMTPFAIAGTSLPNPALAGPTLNYSIEPQLQGTAFSDKLTYVVGSFNSWTKSPRPVIQYTYNMGLRTGTMADSEARTNSAYFEGSYQLTDAFSFMAGYRRSWDVRESATGNYNATGVAVGPTRLRHGEWQAGSYRVGVTWKPNDLTMLYLTNSKGYSSGGFNGGNLPAYLQSYGPESLNNFELGIKSDWYVGAAQLRTNVAVYYGLYEDVQTYVPVLYPNPDTGVLTSGLPTGNAAEGTIRGVEAEFTFLPIASLEFSGNVSYMDNEFTRYEGTDQTDPTGNTKVDLSGVPFVYSPEWKYTINATYHLPIPEALGDLSIGGSYNWQDELASEARQRDFHPYVWNPPLHNFNANITWRDVAGKRGLKSSLFFTNLTDFDRANGQATGYSTSGYFGRAVAVPRSWGLRMSYDF